MGTLKFIENHLPYEWEQVALKYRAKGKLCKAIYASIPKVYKNKYHYKDAIAVARRRLRANSILLAIKTPEIRTGVPDTALMELFQRMDYDINQLKSTWL